MPRPDILVQRLLAGVALTAMATASADAQLTACPFPGAMVDVQLDASAQVAPAAAVVFGSVNTPSCEDSTGRLDGAYAALAMCPNSADGQCRISVDELQPGLWIHRILVISGPGLGQLQARRGLLLDASAGPNKVSWQVYPSVTTVTSLADEPSCVGCLRWALNRAEAAQEPALVQFSPALVGTVRLSAALPPLESEGVTVDALDLDGMPYRRTIDGAGMNNAAIRITGSDNTVLGLRVENVGGNSDAVLIDGIAANRNTLQQLQVVGRGIAPCQAGDLYGCLVDDTCRTQTTDPPFGICGDDAIAVRGTAGVGGENSILDCDISGAFDKGVKISNGAVARVERCHIHDNFDGGLQATLGGRVLASENLIENNQGTNSANGLAANGPDMGSLDPAILVTRGNVTKENSLRGISVRSLSIANLNDDYICGNGTAQRGIGFGLAVLDAAGFPSQVHARGLAVVNNVDGGVVVADTSSADLGSASDPGGNFLGFNGPPSPTSPVNLRNLSPAALTAIGNQWQGCSPGRLSCDYRSVLRNDVFTDQAAGDVSVRPVSADRTTGRIQIDSIEPSAAAAGETVRLYGRGFDAIGGNPASRNCAEIESANSCKPLRGNCVRFGGWQADVLAVTPTMLVVRNPRPCTAPIEVTVHNRAALGLGRHRFCTQPEGGASAFRPPAH